MTTNNKDSGLGAYSDFIRQQTERDIVARKERNKPILAELELLRSDATGTRFHTLLEAMIRYASEGENADDWINTKWQLIAIQLRAIMQSLEYSV